MVDRRIVPALMLAGVVLVAAYGAAWVALIMDHRAGSTAEAETRAAEVAANEAAHAEDGDRLYYRVTTPTGETHVVDVSPLDSAAVLLTASERYGQGSTVEQINAHVARRERTKLPVDVADPAAQRSLLAGLLLLLPASLLLAAFNLRRRVRAIDATWAALQTTLTGTGARVMDAAGIGERELELALAALNAGRGLELAWDRERDRIVDARLCEFTLAVRYCPRCNAQVHARMTADLLDVPSCQRCLAPLEGPEVEQQQASIVERLTAPDPRQARDPRAPFSLGVFIFWSLLFPPLAAAYAMNAAK